MGDDDTVIECFIGASGVNRQASVVIRAMEEP